MLTLHTIVTRVEGQPSTTLNINQEVRRFSIDTRTLQDGDVFVALQGETHHGNHFIPQAIAEGAIAVITDREPDSKDTPYILVKDSLQALTQIGQYQRSLFKGKVCGVTGTVGKTSVKESLSFVIRQMGLKVHASEKSYNNHIGVPLTLANMDHTADVAVIEMGMNHPGEILTLTQLVQPNIAIVTAVGPGHIEFFDSVEDIAKEKVSIAAALVEKGVAILPADSEFYPLMEPIVTQNYHRDVLTFGNRENVDVRAVSVGMHDANLHIQATVFVENVSYTLPTSNFSWINNSLAILATLQALGLDVQEGARHLSNIPMVAGRGKIYSLRLNGKQIRLIDDAYNANPLSMKAALETLASYDTRKIAVIGDMRELGHFGERYHKEMGQLCKALKIDKVITCGTLMKHAYNELSDSQRLKHVDDHSYVLGVLLDQLREGDVVLIKASNGVKLHKVVADLLAL